MIYTPMLRALLEELNIDPDTMSNMDSMRLTHIYDEYMEQEIDKYVKSGDEAYRQGYADAEEEYKSNYDEGVEAGKEEAIDNLTEIIEDRIVDAKTDEEVEKWVAFKQWLIYHKSDIID